MEPSESAGAKGVPVRDPLPELERLTAAAKRLAIVVNSAPCRCVYLGDGDTMTCARCSALDGWRRAQSDDEGSAHAAPEADAHA